MTHGEKNHGRKSQDEGTVERLKKEKETVLGTQEGETKEKEAGREGATRGRMTSDAEDKPVTSVSVVCGR